jgi:tRNA delta(2)-isopentenylpyrophosphate transferase
LGAVIIYADAMQCYKDLQIITARLTREELADVPHLLYGI